MKTPRKIIIVGGVAGGASAAARARRVEKCACLLANEAPPLIFTGDAFAGSKVEGAALSGWAAAEILQQWKKE